MQIRIDNFQGLNTRADGKKGAFCHALVAKNVDVREGSLEPTLSIYTTGSAALYPTAYTAIKKFHIMGDGVTILQWAGLDVDVAKSPNGEPADYRVCYSGDDVPRVTDLAMATCATGSYAAPAKSFVLGIPVPTAIGYVTTSGGTGDAQDRAYVYTITSPWGEESAPSAPCPIISNSVGATVTLNRMGVSSRRYSSNPYAQIGLDVALGTAGTHAATFVGLPVPGYIRFDITPSGFNFDLRVGDRTFLSHNTGALVGNLSHLVSQVSSAGAGWVAVQSNAWPVVSGTTLYRVGPINRFNIINAVYNLPAVGKVTVYLDSVDGLRVGAELLFENAAGMTDLNGTRLITAFVIGADLPTFPGVIVDLTTAQAYTPGSGTATRTAPHNTGEVRITNVTHTAGVATITLESTAHIDVGDRVMILGVRGAYEVNGVRKVATVTAPNTITVALAAMTAYAEGGVVMLPIPYAFQEFAITALAAAGGGAYPAAFTRVITIGANDLAVGEPVIGYDIGGAIECNTVMVVSAIGTGTVTVSMAQAGAAWTAGGYLARVELQARKTIYRTATGTTGAEYEFVDEMGADRCRFVDTLNDTALGPLLETDGWLPPPANMHSIQAHPNGFLQGISGNTLCQSVPFQPHAWPVEFQRDVPADARALNIVGTTAVVLTTDVPYLFTGFSPDSMRRERVSGADAYVSLGNRGHVAVNGGVAYRSRSGIFLVGAEPPRNITKSLLPASTFASAWRTQMAQSDGRIVWIDGDLADGANANGYWIDPAGGERSLTQLEAPFEIYGFASYAGELYVSYLNSTMKYAKWSDYVNDTSFARFTYYTQYLRTPKPVSLRALQVDFDWAAQNSTVKDREAMIVRNVRRRDTGVLGGAALGVHELAGGPLEAVYDPDTTLVIPAEKYLKTTVIANPDSADNQETVFDDFVVYDEAVRMECGILSDVWQVRVLGNLKVSAITIAETIEELEQT